MHIPDGFIQAPIYYLGGYGLTGGLTWFCLHQIQRQNYVPHRDIPKASLLTAAFFVISLVHIPSPIGSFHLVGNGLIGLLLGWYSFLAILIGLFLQATLNHGGLSTLGINAIIIGAPALLSVILAKVWQPVILQSPKLRLIFLFATGAGTLLISASLFVGIMLFNIPADLDQQTQAIALAASMGIYLVQAIIEGLLTVMVINYLTKAKPQLLPAMLQQKKLEHLP
jgi:cobalt/nickel transport system permease protein